MTTPTTSALRHLTSAFGGHAQVQHVETALRSAAQHHTELAGHLRARRDAGHFDVPDPLITRDGAQMLADDHDRRATTYTALADLITVAVDTDDEEDPR